MIKPIKALAVSASLALAGCSQAPAAPLPLTEGSWSIDPDASSLTYVSVKAGEIAENNSINGLSGTVAPDGKAEILIDLASVETGVDIRNERMRELFFEVAQYPTATVSAQIDPASLDTLGIGESLAQPLEAVLNLKGVEAPVDTEIVVTRIAEDRVLAVSSEPVILQADALGLSDGLAQLQELAGLPSITPAVPVTFRLTFQR